jgi:hypothetical protein
VSLVQGSSGFVPVLAWPGGIFFFVGVILAAVLVIYSIYYLIFRVGKE